MGKYNKYLNFCRTYKKYPFNSISNDEIDQDRCLLHCEFRGGVSNGCLDGYIFFNNDSVLIYPSEGAFFKINCNH